MIHRRTPRVLQYGVIQMMLFVMGTILALAVVKETGVLDKLGGAVHLGPADVWVAGVLTGVVSSLLDNFLASMTMISMRDMFACVPDDVYWKLSAFASAAGGGVLCIGSMSGLAFMKMERVRVGWFFRNIGWKCMVGAVAGMAVFWAVVTF